MSEAVIVSSLMMMTSTVSEESLARDRQAGRQAGRQTRTHTHTQRLELSYINFLKVII